MKISEKTGFLILFLGVIICSPGLIQRISNERGKKNVILVPHYNTENSAVNADTIIEYTLQEWVMQGKAGMWSPGMVNPFSKQDVNCTILIFSNPKLFTQAEKALNTKIKNKIATRNYKNNYYIKINGHFWNEIKNIGLGISKQEKKRDNEKEKYIRLINDRWVNHQYIEWIFKDIQADGLIFRREEVLGYPDYIEKVNNMARKKDLKIFLIEFSNQKGIKSVAEGLKAVRLHSIPEALEFNSIIPRIKRGVRERKIRALYLKNKRHIKMAEKMKNEINKIGFSIGSPSGISVSNKINKFSLIGAVMGICGVLIIGWKISLLIIFVSFSILILIGICFPLTSVQIISFLCAICFPVAGAKKIKHNSRGFIADIILIFGFSIMAGIIIASYSSLGSFMVKLNQIRGIKFMYFLPVLLCAYVIFKDRRKYLEEFVTWKGLFSFILLALIGLFYLIRTSNRYPGLVTGIEVKIRLLLEQIFIYRPRFKEFIFGHPLLITGLYFLNRKDTRWAAIFIIGGIVGQVSIINTFMHIHSPFSGSLLRT
ncbi:MAG: DUF5693 family protein, partial [Atribacterota bacterium]